MRTLSVAAQTVSVLTQIASTFYNVSLPYKHSMFPDRLNYLTIAFCGIFQPHKHGITHKMKAIQSEFVQDLSLKAC